MNTHSFLCGVIKMVLIVIANRLCIDFQTKSKNIMLHHCFPVFYECQMAAVVSLETKISEHNFPNNSILLSISLEKTRNIIAALFLIPNEKRSQQTFNRILLWIVWSVGRVHCLYSAGELFSSFELIAIKTTLVAIGPLTAEEIVNGQTDGQIQIIVWCNFGSILAHWTLFS